MVASQSPENPNYSGIHDLLSIEEALPTYNEYLCSRIKRYFEKWSPEPFGLTLEFGAGLGTLAQIYFRKTAIRPEVSEIDPKLIKELHARGFLNHVDLSQIKNKFRNVYTSNVLEHIKDDFAALKYIHESMLNDSILVIYVPAFPILFSSMDSRVGHFRRYTKKRLSAITSAAGFSVIECSYSDSVGFFASFLLKFLDKYSEIGRAHV